MLLIAPNSYFVIFSPPLLTFGGTHSVHPTMLGSSSEGRGFFSLLHRVARSHFCSGNWRTWISERVFEFLSCWSRALLFAFWSYSSSWLSSAELAWCSCPFCPYPRMLHRSCSRVAHQLRVVQKRLCEKNKIIYIDHKNLMIQEYRRITRNISVHWWFALVVHVKLELVTTVAPIFQYFFSTNHGAAVSKQN